MTELERHVNRARQRHGFALDWTEGTGVRHLPSREGEIVRGAILDHANATARARQSAAANERTLARTLARMGIKPETK
jgi:hypothetical protein